MIIEKIVIDKLAENDIDTFEVDTSDSQLETLITLKNSNVEEFLRFIKSHNITTVFYNKAFYDPDIFKITDQVISRLDDDLLKLLAYEIDNYNIQIDDIDFSRPIQITYFALYQGQKVGFFESDYWHLDEGLLLGKEKYLDLIESYECAIDDVLERRKETEEKLKSDLETLIYEDEQFLLCTNQRLRLSYIQQLLNKKNLVQYRELFTHGSEFINPRTAQNYIDLVWKKLKVSN
ncbi:hypothetical protein [Methanobacterium sp.]|uniref:hypothetical protein n=1 Tax=Methanobacterium sp. TaxID=2164 RepID=UPI003158AEFC